MNKFVLIITALFLSFFNFSYATTYYSQVSVGGSRDVTQLSSWKTSVGGGTSPASFTAGDEFHIANADSMSSSALWTISGGGKLVIENNGKFNASGFDHSLTLDMFSSAVYYVKSSYVNLILGTIDANSTVYVLYVPSGTLNHLRYNITYPGNLTLDIENASTTFVSLGSTSNLNVNGNLNIKSNSSSNTFTVVRSISFNIGGDLNILKSTFQGTYNTYTPTFNIAGNFNLVAGIFIGTAYAGAPTFNISGNFNMNGGTFYGTSGGATGNPQFNISGSFNQTGGTYSALVGTGSGRITLNMNGTGNLNALNIGSGNHNLTIAGNVTMLTSFTVGENLTLSSGNLSIGNNILTLNKQLFVVSGGMTGSSISQIIFGASSVGATLPSVTLGTLTINRAGQTVALAGNVTISNNLQLTNGNLSIGNNTLTLNSDLSGSGAIVGSALSNLTIGSNPSGLSFNFPPTALTLNNLIVNRTSGAVLNAPLTVFGNLTLTKGTINNSSNVLTIGSGATITRSAGAISSVPTFSGHYLLVYNGSTGVNTGNELYITSPNILDWLTINNSGGVTLNKNIEINQNLTINAGGVLKASTFTIQEDANWINNGTFTPGTGKVNFYGNTTISGTPTGGHNFYNLEIGAGATLTAPLSANINVSNNFITDPTSIFNHNNGTITFTGSGAQTIPAINYYNLTSTNTGGRTLPNSGTIGISGAFTNGSNTYTITGSSINFNGSSSQNIPAFTFNNLAVSGSSVKTLSAGDITVNSVLSFSNAVLASGANKVIIGSAGSVTGAGSGNYVNGNLQKNFAVGAAVSRTFEIGNSSSYLPITATFATVSVSGNITASTTNGDHSQIASSCIDPSKSVNRFWSLTNSGVSPSNYDVIVNFAASDIDAGATYGNFEGAVYNGSSWQNLTSGSKTATSIALSGASSFGSFQVGESGTIVSVSIAANPGSAICPGTSVTFTATPVNGGTSPSYSWTKNGSPVGSNSDTYVDATLNSADVVAVDMVSNSPCAFQPNASSNTITISYTSGCSYTWAGSLSSVWTTAGNWNYGIVPDSTDDVTIASGTPNNPDITGSVKMKSLSLNSGAVLTLSASGTLNVLGNFTNNGTFTDNGGTTVFKGSTNQTLTGATTFNNLTLNGTGGLTLASPATVTGILSLLNGTLTSAGNLVVNLNTASVAYNTSDLGNISGNIKVKKTVTGIGTHDIACPLSGTTANDLNDNTPVLNYGTRLYTWDGNTASYTGIYSLSTPLVVSTGYALYFTGASTNLDFTGTYNHSASPYSITASHADSVNILVGNPYPSALDWYATNGWTKTNLADVVAYFNGATGKYAYFVNGVSVNGGTQYIPSLNSFWVKRSSSGSATIGLDNRTRVSSHNPALWRKGEIPNCLKITAGIGRHEDEALVRFNEEGTDLYDDHLDAFKIINPDSMPSVYTSNFKDKFSINTLPAENKVIALNLKAGYSGTYTIVIDGMDSFDAQCQIVLEDKLLNVRQEIKGKTEYVCNVNQSDKADRFNLRVAYTINNKSMNSKVLIGSYDKTINLTFNNAGNSASVNIYNIVGQQVTTLENVDIESGNYSFTDAKLSEGLYVVKVSVGNEIFTGKVYIK